MCNGPCEQRARCLVIQWGKDVIAADYGHHEVGWRRQAYRACVRHTKRTVFKVDGSFSRFGCLGVLVLVDHHQLIAIYRTNFNPCIGCALGGGNSVRDRRCKRRQQDRKTCDPCGPSMLGFRHSHGAGIKERGNLHNRFVNSWRL